MSAETIKSSETPLKTVRELLERKKDQHIYTCIMSTPVSEADKLMRIHEIRSLLVTDHENHLWGIITRTDIDNKINLVSLNPAEVMVGKIMTSINDENFTTVDADTTLEECRKLMKKHKIRHLPVVEHEDEPIGIISTTDFSFERFSP